MTESELDSVYTQLCKTMTNIGETQSSLFLARFALLAVAEIGDVATVQRLIADASEEMDSAEHGHLLADRCAGLRNKLQCVGNDLPIPSLMRRPYRLRCASGSKFACTSVAFRPSVAKMRRSKATDRSTVS